MSRKKKVVIVVLLIALLAISLPVAGCGEKEKGEDANGKKTEVDLKSAGELGNEFDFTVFRQVVGEDREDDRYTNVFLSPESLRIALMMTYNGAEGETREAMAKLMGLEGMTLQEANEASAALLGALTDTGEGALVEIANSLWFREDLTFKEEFIKRNEEYYDAQVEKISTPEAINSWVDEKTHGKIDKIVDRIDPMTVLFLINAIYFKGEWSEKFDGDMTRDKDFTLQDGSTIQVPLMSQSGEYQYLANESFQAVELPYGDDGKMSMFVFLPVEGLGLDGFVEMLGSESWDGWMNAFAMKEGDIEVPRFKMEYEKQLNDTLKALGIEVAFDGQRADFTGMIPPEETSENIFISDVLQKTFVEVNEEGTEAAAVTKVEMAETAMPIEEPERFQMRVDRPFFFVIRNNSTGTLLFMGLIVDPA